MCRQNYKTHTKAATSELVSVKWCEILKEWFIMDLMVPRASIKPGTWNIPEHSGTSRNIPEHEKIKILFYENMTLI